MNKTHIAWTEFSWNPWTGCKEISPGCKNCYAKTDAERWRGTPGFPNGFDLTYRWHKLEDPLKRKKPSMIFVNSMSDLYFEDVPLDAIQRVFDVMNRATWHRFQILTKRSGRLLEIADKVTWTPNIWQGVSVENQRWTIRLDDLIKVPATVKFISAEPLLGAIDLTPWLDRIDWVIIGGESGTERRPMRLEWLASLVAQCRAAGVRTFVKQDSAFRPGTQGRISDELCLKEFPKAAVGEGDRVGLTLPLF